MMNEDISQRTGGGTSKNPTADDIERFRMTVYTHYEQHGRDFPWRHTTEPYRILVSEIMLQQTQVNRARDKYEEFIIQFPDFPSLSDARAAEVLRVWQGLGYNRRAIHLQTIARRVCAEFSGSLPRGREQLLTLPGVGSYTAAAIRTFAFNEPEIFIETNIRAVYLHEFFAEEHQVRDRDILPLIEQTLDRSEPRRWYQALMDYGAMLKASGNPSRRSVHHRPQSRFRGSRREARGMILKALLQYGPVPRHELAARLGTWDTRFGEALATLERDGLIVAQDDCLTILS